MKGGAVKGRVRGRVKGATKARVKGGAVKERVKRGVECPGCLVLILSGSREAALDQANPW
jgi:hypothetical protein